jgi:hypothetical protein
VQVEGILHPVVAATQVAHHRVLDAVAAERKFVGGLDLEVFRCEQQAVLQNLDFGPSSEVGFRCRFATLRRDAWLVFDRSRAVCRLAEGLDVVIGRLAHGRGLLATGFVLSPGRRIQYIAARHEDPCLQR